MKPSNKELAAQFRELAQITQEHKQDPNDGFRIKAYSKTADILETLEDDLSVLDGATIQKRYGIGIKSVDKILKAVHGDGIIPKLKEMRNKFGNELSEFTRRSILVRVNPMFMVVKDNSVKSGFKINGNKIDLFYRIDEKRRERLEGMLDGISLKTDDKNIRNCGRCLVELIEGDVPEGIEMLN